MAIHIAGTSAAIGWLDPIPAVTVTELTVAVTITPTATLQSAHRWLFGQWGSDPALQQSFVVFARATDEVGFYLLQAFVGYLGRETTTSPLAVGTTSRIVCRWKASPKTLDIAVNGVSQTITVSDGNDTSISQLNTPTIGVDIGRGEDATQGLESQYSEAAIWTEYVPDWMVAAYGRGLSPRAYRTEASRLYVPLYHTGAIVDEWVGSVGTNSSATDAGTHPAMYYP